MVLSEVSYNFACEWLTLSIEKYGAEIYRTEKHIDDGSKFSNMMVIWAGISTDKGNYIESRKFYYDEERGYLLGE